MTQELGAPVTNNQAELQDRLLKRQSRKCFICDEEIDLVLHKGDLEIDHIVPRADGGKDEENNYALVHATCNRSKSASNLLVARRMFEFERLQNDARDRGDRGANLGHVLQHYGGARSKLRLRCSSHQVEFTLSEAGDSEIRRLPLHEDPLSGMRYFFTVLPLQYIHHDDRINPRSIGANIRGLIEEFMKKRPQLHVGLAWWEPDAEGLGPVKMFDGQHKAAAQILLGAKKLPVRVFVQPDANVLLVANTNAGDKLRQVAFDKAVMRHLGSSLYIERVRQYKQMKGLREDDHSFSEQDLVKFFRGEHREMLRYIIDAARDRITHNKENRLMEFVEWSGKGADRPLAYATVERTFFSEFLFKQALESPLDEGIESGSSPRLLEQEQMIRLMNMFADAFFVGRWDPETGGRQIERRVLQGEPVPEQHLRAWRIARTQILVNVLRWVRLVFENYFAYMGKVVESDRLFHQALPAQLWARVETFLQNVADLPCWVDRNLSSVVFGVKQTNDFWKTIFDTGKAPNGVQVLARGLELQEMIKAKVVPV